MSDSLKRKDSNFMQPQETGLKFNNLKWMTLQQKKQEHKEKQKQKVNSKSKIEPPESRQKQNVNKPCKRWGHCSVQYQNKMLIFGGSGNSAGQKNWDTVFQFDLDTYEWSNFVGGGYGPSSRDSHAAVTVDNLMYIYGGSSDELSLSDMWSLDLQKKVWQAVEQKGDIPKEREGHNMVCLFDRYIFLYGGWNGKQIFNDSYLFDCKTNIWQKVEKSQNSGNECINRESSCLCKIKDYMYLFGGQGATINGQDLYLNDTHKIKGHIDRSTGKCSIVFEKLHPKSEIPSVRASASVCVYKERYMIIIGGEGQQLIQMINKIYHRCVPFLKKYNDQSKIIELEPQDQNEQIKTELIQNQDVVETIDDDDKDDPPCFPKNDIWILDTEMVIWIRVILNNQFLFTSRFTHSAEIYKDSVVVFGGLKDYKTSIEDMCFLELIEDLSQGNDKKQFQEICSICKNEMSEDIIFNQNHSEFFNEMDAVFGDEVNQKIQGKSYSQVSMGYIQKMVNMIQWPISAFGLLTDNSLKGGASTMKINMLDSIQFKKSYIEKMIKLELQIDDDQDQTNCFSRTNEIENKEKMKQILDYQSQVLLEPNFKFIIISDDGVTFNEQETHDIIQQFDYSIDKQDQPYVDKNTSHLSEEFKNYMRHYATNLKLGALRLGDTFVFISRQNKKISMCLQSCNELNNPNLYKYSYFYCSWILGQQDFLTVNGYINQKNIFDSLRGIYFDTNCIIPEKDGNKIIIINLKVDSINQNHEFTNINKDILLNFPKFDIVFPSDVKLHRFIDFSVKTYLEHLYLQPDTKFQIYLQNQLIKFVDLQDELLNLKKLNNLIELNTDSLQNSCLQIKLFLMKDYMDNIYKKKEHLSDERNKFEKSCNKNQKILRQKLFEKEQQRKNQIGLQNNINQPFKNNMATFMDKSFVNQSFPYIIPNQMNTLNPINYGTQIQQMNLIMDQKTQATDSINQGSIKSNEIIEIDQNPDDIGIYHIQNEPSQNGKNQEIDNHKWKYEEDQKFQKTLEDKFLNDEEANLVLIDDQEKSDEILSVLSQSNQNEQTTIKKLYQTQGILLYYKGRIITRYQRKQFGMLILHLKKIYKNQQNIDNKINIFDQIGIINLGQSFQSNMHLTDFESIQSKNILYNKIDDFIKLQFSQEKYNKQSSSFNDLEPKKCIKK